MNIRNCLSIIAAGLAAVSTHGKDPYGLDVRVPIKPFLNQTLPAVAPQTGDWEVVKAFPNLSFPNPLGLIPGPRSNRLFVYTREGQIYYFENNAEAAAKTLFLDISSRTQGWDDCGLLGLAFHPQFNQAGSTNRGYFYVFYQYSPNPKPGPDRPPPTTPSFNHLSRFTVPDGSNVADPNSELVLIDQFDRNIWHEGGAMFFHPDDGFLYLTLGDEGGRNAEYGNTQRIDKGLFSGVIRIDVDQNPAKSHPIRRQPQSAADAPARTAHYFIPNDNPFVDPSGAVLEEFWCIGLRSPHRMTLDPVAKTIWLGDVGQELREEINLIERGGNYQWGFKEGTLPGPLARPAAVLGAEKPPVYEYGHNKGQTQYDGDNCVIGGYVYRGREHAEKLGGKYLFGDNGSGRIWALTPNPNGAPLVAEIANMPAGFGYTGLSSFGVDQNGEVYLCQMGANGQIYKLAQRGGAGPVAPPLLSQTGAFRDVVSLATTDGLIPYEVNSPLWSDGAAKTRWMAVPNDGAPYSANEQIVFSPAGEWFFPDGTVFVKHFELGIDESNPSRQRRLETRFLVRENGGTVYGLTYKWRPNNSDAELLPGALVEELTVKTAAPVGRFGDSRDLGGAKLGSVTFDPNADSYTIRASGADIWGNADQFRFTYQTRTGDFDVKVRIDSLSAESLYTKAGLMARESLAPESRHAFALAFPNNQPRFNNEGGFEFDYRDLAAGPSGAIYPPVPQPRVNYPNTWVRLKREGDEWTAYASGDGVSWTKFATHTLALPSTIYLGMAVTAQNDARFATARFADLANNRSQIWYYPSRKDCVACHTPIANHVLGVKTHQLNGRFLYASTGRADNQLRTLNHLGLLNPSLDEAKVSSYARIVSIHDTSAPLEDRVRSYLAANCAQCHRPGGVRANFDARYETPLSLQSIINGAVNTTLNVAGARVVSPGLLARSIMHLRINTTDENKMPPLARNRIDTQAVATFAEWISRLPLAPDTLGLRAEYFDNIDLTALKLTRTDDTVNFDWGLGSPDPAIAPDTFSARWTGQVEPRFSEIYTFYAISDDGVRLWIDEKLVIDNWTDHAPTEDKGSIPLVAGRPHSLRMEYFENGVGAVARLEWSSPSQPREVIPPSQLTVPGAGPGDLKPPALSQLERLGNGNVRLLMTSPTLGNYQVQASGNLSDWVTLMTFSNTNGTIFVIDAQATNYLQRFYRAIGGR